MSRKIARRSRAKGLLVAVMLALGALSAVSHPGRALASFSGSDRQEQTVAAEPAAVAAAPASPVGAAPASPSTASAAMARQQQQMARQRQMAARQRAMRGAMAQHQAHVRQSRRAARRAFVGGLIIGVLAGRRR